MVDFQFGLVCGNQTRPNYSFSQKFLRNHFLVSTFLKWLLFFGISQLFSLYCNKIFLKCIWESISFPKQRFSRTPLNSHHSILFDSEFHPNKNTTLCQTYLKPSQTSKMKLLVKVVKASRDIFRTVFSIQNIFRISRMALFTKLMNGWKLILISCWVLKMPLDLQSSTIFTKNCILDL